MAQTGSEQRLDERFDRIDSELGSLRSDVTDLRSECRAGFSEVNTRIDGTQRTMTQTLVVLSGSMLTGFVALFTLIATKL
jgi:hypothetical protein